MRYLLLSLLCVSLVPTLSAAAGFQITSQSPAAMGRGHTGVASADDAAALAVNPALLSSLGALDLFVGGHLERQTALFREETADTLIHADASLSTLPALFVAYRLTDVWEVGLGLYTPYALHTRWPESAPGRALAISEDFFTLAVGPTAALDARNWIEGLRLGATVEIVRATAQRDHAIFFGDEIARSQWGGAAWGVAGRLGMHYNPAPLAPLSLGLALTSPTVLHFSGTVDLDSPADIRPALPADGDADMSLTLPYAAVLGARYTLWRTLSAHAEAAYTGWSTVDTLTMTLPDATEKRWVRDYRNTLSVRGGIEWQHPLGAVRGGYAYEPSPVKAKRLEPGFPDADSHHLTAGMSLSSPFGVTLELAFDYALPTRRTTGKATYTPSVKGQYETRTWLVSAAFVLSVPKAPETIVPTEPTPTPLPEEFATP